MIIERPAAARGTVDLGWLRSKHSFSFGHYHDPAWMGFGPLRVINDDTVAPGGGFAPHRHANMEILSVVLDGALAHRDSTGTDGVIRAGEVQWMSAGHGIEHSEYNGSDAQPVHFLQIWIQPDRLNAQPAYAQQYFDPEARCARWAALVSSDGADGSIAIRQQATLRATRLQPGDAVAAVLDPARKYWLHVATGEVAVGERVLVAGDALGFDDEGGEIALRGIADASDVLLFDLPA
ncbi:pirin family protein [Thermomonas sp. HDW16]|uniref:pirin family protein n=1 Tax=Thermomonas sp. HDW16 TaxID=2714945 RepID=UPI001407CEF8|nr:pirin family protein [Thermomonas sp. HDW16]QIL19827.1 pirin family protein [Thermomonas sp. HDW16]